MFEATMCGRSWVRSPTGSIIIVGWVFLSDPSANMADFFRFENQREPPILADRESLRSGKKADILQCLCATTGRVAAAQQATVVVLTSRQSSTCAAHTSKCVQWIRNLPNRAISVIPTSQEVNDTQRMEAVWDSYPTCQFLGCGKNTAWSVWISFPDLTDTLVALTLSRPQVDLAFLC